MEYTEDLSRKRKQALENTSEDRVLVRATKQKRTQTIEEQQNAITQDTEKKSPAPSTPSPAIPSIKFPDFQEIEHAVAEVIEEQKKRKEASDLRRKYLYQAWKAENPELAGNGRKESDYLETEWKEQNGVLEWCRRYGASIERIQTDINTKKLINRNPRIDPKVKVTEPAQLIDHEVVLVDKNGDEYLLYLEFGLSLPWVDTSHESLCTEDAQEILDQLDARYPTPEPPDKDSRHPTSEFQKKKAHVNSMGWPCGVYHTGFSIAKGHERDVHYKPAKPFNHGLSAQTKGNCQENYDAVIKSYSDMAPLEQTLGILFESVLPDVYKKDKAHLEKMEAATGETSLHFTNRKCKEARAILRSVQVKPHKDGGLNRGDMCIMHPVGNFKGGELWLPDIDLRIKYRPGSVVILPACLLQHAVSDAIGQRSSIVYYSKSSEETLIQNWAFMDISERWDWFKVRATKVAKDAAFVARQVKLGNRYEGMGDALIHPEFFPERREKFNRCGVNFVCAKFDLVQTVKVCLTTKFGVTKDVKAMGTEGEC